MLSSSTLGLTRSSGCNTYSGICGGRHRDEQQYSSSRTRDLNATEHNTANIHCNDHHLSKCKNVKESIIARESLIVTWPHSQAPKSFMLRLNMQ